MDTFIIDAIGPFFHNYTKETINWSKIPFTNLEDEDSLDDAKIKRIRKEFKKFIDTVSDLGYNAISIDDLAHLVAFDFYDADLKSLIQQYQDEFSRLFAYARKKGMKIFINTDVMFFNPSIEKHTSYKLKKITELLAAAFKELFQRFDVDGVILRIGETDGIDVQGRFKSKLVLKTAQQANKAIKKVLPIFEDNNKQMIVRTWTVGSYPIGDLMWNEKTFAQTFSGIESKNFIISLKYGDTDFFDDLELNPLFASGSQQKIIELQTRREREGFGELPYYVGWQYENYYAQLCNMEHIVGVSVWCQSGGWSSWSNRTFLKESSFWNELNTKAVIDIYRHGLTADESLLKTGHNAEMATFVRHAYHVLHDILYIKEFSQTPLYFRRLRIPPLIWLFWDHVVLNPLLLAFMQYVNAGKFKIPKKELESFYRQGRKLGIANIDYMHDTVAILARCRRALWKKSIKAKHSEQIARYTTTHEMALKFSIHLSQLNYSKADIVIRLLVRRRARYRIIDWILLSPPVSAACRLAYRMLKKNLPSFANKQAMHVDMLFK